MLSSCVRCGHGDVDVENFMTTKHNKYLAPTLTDRISSFYTEKNKQTKIASTAGS